MPLSLEDLALYDITKEDILLILTPVWHHNKALILQHL